MRIEPLPPSAASLPGFVRFAASIEYDQRPAGREILWFDLPESFSAAVQHTGDAWLLATLPLAFRSGKPLEVTLPVDSVLLRNAATIQDIWHGWHPDSSPVPIRADGQTENATAAGGRTGLFFTAGVDSFFTLLHYDATLRATESPHTGPVDDLIYVWGYDIPLTRRDAWDEKRDRLAEVARRLGKNFIPIVTNLRETRLRKLPWGEIMHGPALCAVGVLMGSRFSHLLLSSGGKEKDLYPWGSHPRVDPLMSTSRTRVTRYSGECDRFEKAAFIAGSDVALQHLHVCWENRAARNCGRCEKCLRTMLALDLLGARNRAGSFPPVSLNLDAVRGLHLRSTGAMQVMEELAPHARRLGQAEIADAIDACVQTSRRLNAARERSPSRRLRGFFRNSLARLVPVSNRPAN